MYKIIIQVPKRRRGIGRMRKKGNERRGMMI
jgi:hypothetical protein